MKVRLRENEREEEKHINLTARSCVTGMGGGGVMACPESAGHRRFVWP